MEEFHPGLTHWGAETSIKQVLTDREKEVLETHNILWAPEIPGAM
jgi:hypothetical protein